MKKLSLVITVLLVFVACKKAAAPANSSAVSAKIKGADIRACACCGGWIMDVGATQVRAFYNVDSVDVNNDSIILITYTQPASVCGGMNELVEIQTATDN